MPDKLGTQPVITGIVPFLFAPIKDKATILYLDHPLFMAIDNLSSFWSSRRSHNHSATWPPFPIITKPLKMVLDTRSIDCFGPFVVGLVLVEPCIPKPSRMRR